MPEKACFARLFGCFVALHKDDVWGEKWFWAPEVYKIGDKYFMTYSAEEHICYAESDSPCGPFIQRDKRPYLPNEKGIDSHIFFEKGRAYIFWVRFDGPYGIWMAELTSDLHALKMETAQCHNAARRSPHLFCAKKRVSFPLQNS